jgi:hypothetical protein
LKIVWGRSLGWNIELNKMVKLTRPVPMSVNGMGKLHPSSVEYNIITDGCDCYPWHEIFFIFPRKTINGKWLWWTKGFKRKVWVVWGKGYHMEPHVEYATAFDIINDERK